MSRSSAGWRPCDLGGELAFASTLQNLAPDVAVRQTTTYDSQAISLLTREALNLDRMRQSQRRLGTREIAAGSGKSRALAIIAALMPASRQGPAASAPSAPPPAAGKLRGRERRRAPVANTGESGAPVDSDAMTRSGADVGRAASARPRRSASGWTATECRDRGPSVAQDTNVVASLGPATAGRLLLTPLAARDVRRVG